MCDRLLDTDHTSNNSMVAGSSNRSSEISAGVGADSHSSDTCVVPYFPPIKPPIPTDQNANNPPPRASPRQVSRTSHVPSPEEAPPVVTTCSGRTSAGPTAQSETRDGGTSAVVTINGRRVAGGCSPDAYEGSLFTQWMRLRSGALSLLDLSSRQRDLGSRREAFERRVSEQHRAFGWEERELTLMEQRTSAYELIHQAISQLNECIAAFRASAPRGRQRSAGHRRGSA